MALAMSRPWKHPNTGVYWLRKRVPDELRDVLGKREEKRSLRTKDPTEAKIRHSEALLEVERRWEAVRTGRTGNAGGTLSPAEAERLAASVYDRLVPENWHAPSGYNFWPRDLGDEFLRALETRSATHTRTSRPARMQRLAQLEVRCRSSVRVIAHREGLELDDQGERALVRAVGIAMKRASLRLEEEARSRFAGARNGHPIEQQRSLAAGPAVLLGELLGGWQAERRPTQKTVYEWTRVLRQLERFLGHDDAKRIRPEDLLSWKASLIEAGLRPKTIRDAKIAPVRAVLQWAVDNRRLPRERGGADHHRHQIEAR